MVGVCIVAIKKTCCINIIINSIEGKINKYKQAKQIISTKINFQGLNIVNNSEILNTYNKN